MVVSLKQSTVCSEHSFSTFMCDMLPLISEPDFELFLDFFGATCSVYFLIPRVSQLRLFYMIDNP